MTRTILCLALALPMLAQPPAGQQRPRGPRPLPGPEPVPLEDRTGFESIFDGTLKNWDGDPAFWRVEDGAIVGETTKDKALKQNTFIIWRGGEPSDFELKLEFRINNTNSGIQYRSVQLPASDSIGKWVLKGYQSDIDFQNIHTGLLYEERGRGFLAPRGILATRKDDQDTKGKILGNIHSSEELRGYLKINDWNTVHVIARGNLLIHIYNGKLMSAFLDDDAKNRMMKGLLGFQIHTGPPMKVEFRNIFLKNLSN